MTSGRKSRHRTKVSQRKLRQKFFHARERERRKWEQMLSDAPMDYSPHWIDVIAEPVLRKNLRAVYMQMREEAATEQGVTVLRDLLLRRVLYLARIMDRVEGLIETLREQDMIATHASAGVTGRLLNAEKYYLQLAESMADLVLVLEKTGPKRKKAPSPTGPAAGTVEIPVE